MAGKCPRCRSPVLLSFQEACFVTGVTRYEDGWVRGVIVTGLSCVDFAGMGRGGICPSHLLAQKASNVIDSDGEG